MDLSLPSRETNLALSQCHNRAPSPCISSPPPAPACALLALLAAARGAWAAMFLWLGLAPDRRWNRRHAGATVCSQRGAAALVGRCARRGGRFHHLCVRSRLCDRGVRPAAAGRRILRVASLIVVSWRDLFRRPRDEAAGPFLSRLSGAVERGGVLSVPDRAAALDRRLWRCSCWSC